MSQEDNIEQDRRTAGQGNEPVFTQEDYIKLYGLKLGTRKFADYLESLKSQPKAPKDFYMDDLDTKNSLVFCVVALILALIIYFWPHNAEASEDWQISEHFKLSEFNQRHAPLPLDSIMINPKLVKALERLRSLIGDRPIIVHSGYRSPAYNQKVGGAKHSQHIHGKAADITVHGMTAGELEPYARAAGFTFTQTYKNSPHLHVDIRSPR